MKQLFLNSLLKHSSFPPGNIIGSRRCSQTERDAAENLLIELPKTSHKTSYSDKAYDTIFLYSGAEN